MSIEEHRRNALWDRVDEVLYYVWDPGVRDVPDVRDEYRSYVGRIVSLLESGADEQAIVSHLLSFESEAMGLSRYAERNDEVVKVAVLLLRWKHVLYQRGA